MSAIAYEFHMADYRNFHYVKVALQFPAEMPHSERFAFLVRLSRFIDDENSSRAEKPVKATLEEAPKSEGKRVPHRPKAQVDRQDRLPIALAMLKAGKPMTLKELNDAVAEVPYNRISSAVNGSYGVFEAVPRAGIGYMAYEYIGGDEWLREMGVEV